MVARLSSQDVFEAGYVPFGVDAAQDLTGRMDAVGVERADERSRERESPGERRTGLMGGAPRNRRHLPHFQHAYKFVDVRLRLLEREVRAESGVEEKFYAIQRPDPVQDHCYVAREFHGYGGEAMVWGSERTISIVPEKMRCIDVRLTRSGEWAPLGGSRMFVPDNEDAYVCPQCHREWRSFPCNFC